MPIDNPFACASCGRNGVVLTSPSTGTTLGNVVIGLDPDCEGCRALADAAGTVFPPRFGGMPLDEE
jgi:hypothetical protein